MALLFGLYQLGWVSRQCHDERVVFDLDLAVGRVADGSVRAIDRRNLGRQRGVARGDRVESVLEDFLFTGLESERRRNQRIGARHELEPIGVVEQRIIDEVDVGQVTEAVRITATTSSTSTVSPGFTGVGCPFASRVKTLSSGAGMSTSWVACVVSPFPSVTVIVTK